jgi:predicted GNAT family acetyltransferase
MADEQQAKAEVDVVHEPDGTRYVALVGGERAGFAEYRLRTDRTTFTHTVIEERFGGRGVGSALIRTALDEERAAGHAVEPRCPFVADFIRRHPDYADLVPDEHRHLLDR